MRYHCRCTSKKCQRRVVKRRHPTWYLRHPKCSFCGSLLRVDKWMQNRDTSLQGAGCNCFGYHFMHRKGSLYCEFRKDGSRRIPSDPDFHDQLKDWHNSKNISEEVIHEH